MKDEVAGSFDHRVYQGGLTFNGHPISLAAAVANLEALEEDRCIEHAQELEPLLLEELSHLTSRIGIVGDARGIGLFGAIELVEDLQSRVPLDRTPDGIPALKYVQRLARERGLFISGRGNILLVVPPLIITPDQLKEGFRQLEGCLQELEARVLDPGSVQAS